MIPIEISGHSFKGLIKYLIEPKKGNQDAPNELRRLVYTANMLENKPRNSREVIAIMAYYSREDVRRGLMESAQIRGRGGAINKSKPPVRHIVLAFPDGSEPEKELIKGAVKGALSSLEGHNGRTLADHQYAVYLHQDTEHWHAHIVVNLIDHRTGRLADPYRSQQKLQRWAYEWCKTNGFDVCAERQKKYEQIEANRITALKEKRRYKDGEGYKNLRGEHYHLHQYKKQKNVLDVSGRSEFFKDKVAALREKSTQHYQRRSEEKNSLYMWKVQQRARIKAHFSPLLKKEALLKENPRPFTLDAFQRADRRQFFKREKTVAGRVLNTAVLALESGGEGLWESFLRYSFMKPEGRRIVLFQNQYRKRKQTKRYLRIKQKEYLVLEKLNKVYASKLTALKNKHHHEISEERLDWRALNEVRFRKAIKEKSYLQQRHDRSHVYGAQGQSSKPKGPQYVGKNTKPQIVTKNGL